MMDEHVKKNRDTRPTAAIIIIGDEILKGHTQDTNSHFLCQRLYKLGVQVKKISVIPDDIQAIASEVSAFAPNFTYVLTTGGVGPTHDDVTYAGVAEAFGDSLVENTKLVQLFNEFYSQDEMVTAQKMAMIPALAKIHFLTNKQSGVKYGYPVMSMRNVYVFPGIPTYMETAFDCLSDLFHSPNSEVFCVEMYFNEDEVSVAPALNKAVGLFHNKVVFGSYPEVDHSFYKVKLTLESDSDDHIKEAFAYLQEQLPSSSFIYYEKDIVSKAAQQVYNLVKYSAENSFTKSVQQAVEVIHECLEHYPLSDVCVSFNGGKDCTVLLHLVYAVMRKKYPHCSEPLQAMYIQCSDPFRELEEFIQRSAKRYNLKLFVLKGQIKVELQNLTEAHPHIKVMLMGSRRTDPHMVALKHVQMTDPGWPQLLRISPLLDWSYEDVWMFLRQLCLPYCPLYDKGYTSLGSTHNTFPNPALKAVTKEGKEYYKPAYTLADPTSERDGRQQKLVGDFIPKQKFKQFLIWDLQSICATLNGIVKRTFGPNGQVGLVLSSTGQPLLTSTGVELFKSMNFTDPIARVILNSISRHHDSTGDGSKEFVLILLELIRLCEYGLDNCRRLQTIKLARAFGKLQETVIPKLASEIKLTLYNSNVDTERWPLDKIVKSIVTGFIAGKFGERVTRVLTDLVLGFLNQSSLNVSSLNSVVNHLIGHFAVICICAEGKPVSDSCICRGAIVSRSFATSHICDQQTVAFIVVKCALNYLQEEESISFDVNSQNVSQALQLNINQLKKLFAEYQKIGVQLIVTNRTFSQVMLYLCNQNSIAVIHAVEDDELERIEELSGIVPVCDAFDSLESYNMAHATTVAQVVIGSSSWVCLDFPSISPFVKVNHAVIYGPSQAVNKQYGTVIKNCLKCVRSWCQASQEAKYTNDEYKANVANMAAGDSKCKTVEVSDCGLVPVGGCWEILFNRILILHAESLDPKSDDMKIACKLLAKALLAVPQIILQNSWNGYRFRFVEVWQEMACPEKGLKYIDGMTGLTINATDTTASQVIHSKLILLNNLLSLMRQLLRLDGILHVEKNIIEC